MMLYLLMVRVGIWTGWGYNTSCQRFVAGCYRERAILARANVDLVLSKKES